MHATAPTIQLVAPHGASEPITQVSRKRAADMLRLSVGAIAALESSGYLPDRSITRILELAQSPFMVAVDRPVPVLRQADASPAPDHERDVRLSATRAWIGDSAFLSDQQVLEACRAWWRTDPDAICEAGILPVTRAGFVTTVLRIDGLAGTDRVDVPATEAKGAYREIRHCFHARLAGRVGALGDPASYQLKDQTVEGEYRELTQRMLGRRSAARSGGPMAYLPTIAAPQQ